MRRDSGLQDLISGFGPFLKILFCRLFQIKARIATAGMYGVTRGIERF